jgi:hypothetical protein
MDPMQELVEKVKADSMRDTSRLAEIIRDYNSTLELRWIPKKMRTDPGDDVQPFVIVQNFPNGGEALVMYLTEQEVANPPGVLARLFNSDNSKHGKGGVLARVENSERARRIWEKKQEAEKVAEKMDFWKSIWQSSKHTYRHKGQKYDTQTGVVS